MNHRDISAALILAVLPLPVAASSDDNWWKAGGGSITIPIPEGVPVGEYRESSPSYERPEPRLSAEERAKLLQEKQERKEHNAAMKRAKELDRRVKALAPELRQLARAAEARLAPAAGTLAVSHRETGPFMVQSDGREMTLVMPFTGIRTPASQIPAENLRRAAAIAEALAPADGKSQSEEDQYYLANQMAQAMEGAPLSVDIVDLGRGGEKGMRQVAEQGVKLENLFESFERARTERLACEERLVKIAERQKSGTILSAEEVRERDTLLGHYRITFMKESRLKESIAQTSMQTVIIMEGKSAKAGK